MTKPITTTLNAVRPYLKAHWKQLLKHLGKTKTDDEPLRFSTIAEAVGVHTAYRCLDSLSQEHNPLIWKLKDDATDRVLHIFEKKFPGDTRFKEAVQATRDYADGKITKKQFDGVQTSWTEPNDVAKTCWDNQEKTHGELLIQRFG